MPTQQAIATHGAVAVYRAACRALEGDYQPLAEVGVAATTLREAWEVQTSAYKSMSAGERAAEQMAVNAALMKYPPEKETPMSKTYTDHAAPVAGAVVVINDQGEQVYRVYAEPEQILETGQRPGLATLRATLQPRRCWINQPSTLQPLHKLHGQRVLAIPYTDTSQLIYFLEGDVVSQAALNLCLSEGWPDHLRAAPPTTVQLQDLAVQMLSMLCDLEKGYPWGELCLSMETLRAEAKRLGVELEED